MSNLLSTIKSLIKEQSSKYRVGDIYEAVRSTDNKKYKIQFFKIDNNQVIVTITSIDNTGMYGKNKLDGKYSYTLNIGANNILQGDKTMGNFTNLRYIENKNQPQTDNRVDKRKVSPDLYKGYVNKRDFSAINR